MASAAIEKGEESKEQFQTTPRFASEKIKWLDDVLDSIQQSWMRTGVPFAARVTEIAEPLPAPPATLIPLQSTFPTELSAMLNSALDELWTSTVAGWVEISQRFGGHARLLQDGLGPDVPVVATFSVSVVPV